MYAQQSLGAVSSGRPGCNSCWERTINPLPHHPLLSPAPTQGIAWLADLDGSFSYRAQGILALAMTVLACVPVATTIPELPEEPEKEQERLYEPLSVNDQQDPA